MSKDQIIAEATRAIFGKPLVTNVYRSVLTEAVVARALPDWEWVSADYGSYDFRHPTGLRLEVKQSALRQSWVSLTPPKPSWDIKPRTGYWSDGNVWVPSPGRNADIYVLGLHDVIDDTADHRDPNQWKFFVIVAASLPATQRLSLRKAEMLSALHPSDQLADAVKLARTKAQGVTFGRPDG